MEADGETPWEACRREVREECGVDVRHGRLACMDFRRARPERPGGIRYLFDCGQLDRTALAGVVLQPEEISEYRFAALPDALGLLRGPIRRRVRAATRGQGKRVIYLEDGRPVPGVGKPDNLSLEGEPLTMRGWLERDPAGIPLDRRAAEQAGPESGQGPRVRAVKHHFPDPADNRLAAHPVARAG